MFDKPHCYFITEMLTSVNSFVVIVKSLGILIMYTYLIS